MFAQFLEIFFKSLKLDRSLYRDNKYFGEAAIYFAGLVMILDGVAGAVAANSIVNINWYLRFDSSFNMVCMGYFYFCNWSKNFSR